MIRSNKQREKFCSMRIKELVFIYLKYIPYWVHIIWLRKCPQMS